MKGIIFIACLLSALIQINGLQKRIFGGSDAPANMYKYHVHLTSKRGSNTYCGGSIINKRWVLTAAHCFKEENIRKILVQAGSILRSGQGGTIYRVEKRIPHEAFDLETLANDIALLRIDRDIEFNDQIQPVDLAGRETVIGDGESVVFTGFGRTRDFTRAEILQFISLKMYGYSTCRLNEPHIINTQICTLPENGNGPCIGDSGGPLVNRFGVQVGVYSHEFGFMPSTCGQVPDIFTQVSSYRDWIDTKMTEG